MKLWKRAIRMRELNPFMPTATIAASLSTSRSNVHNILTRRGLITNVPRPHTIPRCKMCGEVVMNSRLWHNEECKFDFLYLQVSCKWCTISFYRHRDAIVRSYREKYKGMYCTKEHFYASRRNKEVVNDSRQRFDKTMGAESTAVRQ